MKKQTCVYCGVGAAEFHATEIFNSLHGEPSLECIRGRNHWFMVCQSNPQLDKMATVAAHASVQ